MEGVALLNLVIFPNSYVMYSSSYQIDADLDAGGHSQLHINLPT